MTRILVQSEYLRNLASQCRRQADELRSLAGNLGAALGGLDWQVRESSGVDGDWQRARWRGLELAEHAESLARLLDRKAEAFDEADSTGAMQIDQIAGVFSASQQQWAGWWQRLQPVLSFPQGWLDHVASFGQNLISAPLTWVASGLGAASAVVGGLLIATKDLLSPQAVPSGPPPIPTAIPPVEHGAPKQPLTNKMDSSSPPTAVPSLTPLPEQVVRLSDGRQMPASQLDGRTPADGLDSIYGKPGQFPLKAPIGSTPDARHPDLYARAIDQFGVEGNPRYARDESYTYCNTFAGDVARAMGVPLPTKSEFLGTKGDPATVAAADLHRWFATQSVTQGWREVDPSTPAGMQLLQDHVNAGRPAMAVDPGHIAVIRPGQQAGTPADLRIAQAGAHNLDDVPLGDVGLGSAFNPKFFIHD